MIQHKPVTYREAREQDIPFLGKMRAMNEVPAAAWQQRILAYLQGTLHPQQSLPSRVIYVAEQQRKIVGFIAGHATRRYGCDGELQWIDVLETRRRRGIATGLLQVMATWFVNHHLLQICVDPGNATARHFYGKNGATSLNEHWMCWQDISEIIQ